MRFIDAPSAPVRNLAVATFAPDIGASKLRR